MLPLPVPDYFQEEGEVALRERVRWLEEEVGLGAPFFRRLLRTDEEGFERWKAGEAALPEDRRARGARPVSQHRRCSTADLHRGIEIGRDKRQRFPAQPVLFFQGASKHDQPQQSSHPQLAHFRRKATTALLECGRCVGGKTRRMVDGCIYRQEVGGRCLGG